MLLSVNAILHLSGFVLSNSDFDASLSVCFWLFVLIFKTLTFTALLSSVFYFEVEECCFIFASVSVYAHVLVYFC